MYITALCSALLTVFCFMMSTVTLSGCLSWHLIWEMTYRSGLQCNLIVPCLLWMSVLCVCVCVCVCVCKYTVYMYLISVHGHFIFVLVLCRAF